MKKIIFLVLILPFVSCSHPESKPLEPVHTPDSNSTAPKNAGLIAPHTEVHVIASEANQKHGFGYEVFVDGKLFIRQPIIPAIAGQRVFSTESNAKKAGEFTAYKIKNHMMPPSISQKELDSLQVLN